jgi:hypothetical protein
MASKETAAARNRRITAQNKAFDKLSPAEKRITLARDVIVQLAAGKLIADHVYAEGNLGSALFKELKLTTDCGDRVPDQKVELLKAAKCRVCGIGSLFVCGVKRADRLFGKDLGWGSDEYAVERSDNVKYLKRFFTDRQLDLIEEVYENSGDHPHWESVEDDTERMTLIMQNIVANGGTFKPNKTPVATFTMPGYKD